MPTSNYISVEDVLNSTYSFLKNANIGNRNKVYTPSGGLALGSILVNNSIGNFKVPALSGTLHHGSPTATFSGGSTTVSVGIKIKTNSSIPSELLQAVQTTDIISQFDDFKNKYLSSLLTDKKEISKHELLLYILIVLKYINAHFYFCTDRFYTSHVILYKKNVSDSVYTDIQNILNIKEFSITTNLDTYIDLLCKEITSINNIITLQAASTSASCSSSSCSSSCSSSSCSSSSSSSSSGFILYLK